MSPQRLVLLCIFFLDVHVKAETVSECWGKTIPCPVQASASKKVISAGNIKVSIGPHGLLEQRDEKTIQLVSGEFYVETAKPVVFKTPYAKVWCDGECKALFNRETDKLDVKSLEGRWLVQRNGEKTTYAVPEAQQISISEVTEDGRAEMEFPQSLPWAPTVKKWGALYPGTLDELKPTLVKFRETWKQAVESVSEMHSQAASRTIASYENSQAKERARKAAQEREDQRLRAIFREKNP
ncbi:MAG: hypothetical protein ACXVA9_12210 [Bdellovibrionales bacterium]